MPAVSMAEIHGLQFGAAGMLGREERSGSGLCAFGREVS